MINRGLYYASEYLTKPSSPLEAGLVRAHDVTLLIVKQAYVVIFSLVLLAVTAIFANELFWRCASFMLGALLVLLYTCIGAKWVFSFRGAQQARQIYTALWKAQIFKIVLVVVFFVWACNTAWVEPVAALLGLGVMQLVPLVFGGVAVRVSPGKIQR